MITFPPNKLSLFAKIDHLRTFFRTGSFLESLEEYIKFPTLHVEYLDKIPECQEFRLEDSHFKTTIATFSEVSVFRAAGDISEKKCFLLLGFKIPEDGCVDEFLRNWKEVTGLGNFLLFLSQKYFVRRVIFMKNTESVGRDENMFQFLLMMEVFHEQGNLIYLLDYVQTVRSWRNVGFLSLYGEIPANVQD